MLEVLTGVVAKLVGLGTAAKATVGITAAAAAVATAGATGVLPDLPQQADRAGAEQVHGPAGVGAEDVGAIDVEAEDVEVEVEVEDVEGVEVPAAPAPAPQASFGQGVAADARDGGVVGSEIAEQARQQAADRRPAIPEQATSGTERADEATKPRPATPAPDAASAGRETADAAPVEDAPAGTPAEGRTAGKR